MADEPPEGNEFFQILPCFPFYKLQYSPKIYFKHWEVQLLCPTIIMVLITMGLVIYFNDLYPYIATPKLKFLATLILFICLFMFLWSYFSAVLMDPGFLPFTWYTTQRTKYSWQEQLEGIALFPRQFDYAVGHPRPAGSCFSHAYGRFVLRPDHICGWIANWVGKRNHKQFILFMFYGSLLSASFAIPHLFPLKEKPPLSVLMTFFHPASIFVEIVLSIFLISAVIEQLVHLNRNTTALQIMKDQSHTRPHNGFTEICGTGSKLYWLCPTPAFGDNIPFELEFINTRKFDNAFYASIPVQDVPILDDDDVL